MLMLLCFSTSILAESISVTGRVTDENGEALIGAGIQVEGTTQVSITDIDGNFYIKVDDNSTLLFSALGFITQKVDVKSNPIINVVLQTQSYNLDETIVVAYATAKKGTYTGSASVVKSDAIKDVPSSSFEGALNGKVAGLQVTTLSGQAGSTSTFRIRGIGSMNASSEPLYVIDGVPVTSGDGGQMSDYLYTSNNVMSTLNPNDIESITVLKDAAASSLYGSRAANGVVLITTKKGKKGKAQVTLKASVAFTPSWATDNWESASPEEQIEMYYLNFYNAEIADGEDAATASATALYQLNNRFNKHGYAFEASDNTVNTLTVVDYDNSGRAGTYYDWEDALFRTAVYQSYDLSVSGGTDQTSYYTSLSYTDETGRSISNDFSRLSGRLNLTQKIGKYMELSSNVNLAQTTKTGYNDTRSTGSNYFFQTRNLLWPMYWPTDYSTGEAWTSRYGSYAYNALYYNDEWENTTTTTKIAATENLAINVTPDLVLRTIFSYDNTSYSDYLYYSANHYNGSSYNGTVDDMSTVATKMVSSTTANYSKSIGDKHDFSVLAGFEAEKNETDYIRASGSDFATSALKTVATAGTLDANAYSWGNSMMSLLSKAEYDYDGKYFASASFRRDGSSQLGPDTRWGNFWSVAGAWRVNEENFLKDVSWLSSLRLRGSYGTNGTLPTDNYGWRALTSYGYNYDSSPGGALSNVASSDLTWETSYSSNLALEFGILNQRIYGTIELYNRDSKNLLQDVPISTVTGFSSSLQNIGEINNKGIEIEIGGDIYRSKDLRWSASLTASFMSSTVTELYDGQDIVWYDPTGGDSRAQFIYREGESTLALYGYEWAGVDDATGLNMWFLNDGSTSSDLMVDGRAATYDYSDAEEVLLQDMHPTVYGGINTDVEWKNFSLGLNFTYRLGSYTYDGVSKDVNDDGYYWERIMSETAYSDSWSTDNTTATYAQRLAIDSTDAQKYSSRNLNNGDYIRLKNLQFGYNIPQSTLKKIQLSKARVFFNATNLFTIAAYDEYDPETNEYYTKGWETPAGKTFTFGIEITY